MNSLKNKKGFTLIEIVIVLAIAALIILVVLQAVNAAQRGQRDNARKNKAAQVVSYLTEYSSNNNGVYPTTAQVASPLSAGVLASYATGDATLGAYIVVAGPAYAAGWAPTTQCASGASNSSGKTTLVYSPGTSNYGLAVCLEAGGYDTVHN